MRSSKFALCLVAVLAVALWMPSSAYAGKDEFENGFKQELGAIGARTVVGLGIGLFNGVTQGGVGYNGLYAYPGGGYYEPQPYGYGGGRGYPERGYYRYESYEREYRDDGPYYRHYPPKKFKHHRRHDDHHHSHGPSCGGSYYHYEYERYRRY